MDFSWNKFIQVNQWSEPMSHWASALAVFALVVLVWHAFKRVLLPRTWVLVRLTRMKWDDDFVRVVSKTKWYFVYSIGLYLAAGLLSPPAMIATFLKKGVTIVVFVQVLIWSIEVLDILFSKWEERREPGAAWKGLIGFMHFGANISLCSLILLSALSNIGVNITALLAGLGVGGIAVALAVQRVLGDFIASLSIVLDEPFAAGDFIAVGSFLGTVEKIGIKTTRVRSLSGEQIAIPNADLVNREVHNYQRMQERRVPFRIAVVYQTHARDVESLPGLLREIIERVPKTRFDRAHFAGFGVLGLEFEVVFYVVDPNYNVYMDVLQAVNLGIFREFEQRGIMFAYPTASQWLVKGLAGEAEWPNTAAQ